MRLDASSISPGSTLESDVCIIGAGPAGLVLAAELADSDLEILILESGRPGLNDGDCVGDAYVGLRGTRHRGLGGTAGIWNTPVPGGIGAKYVPLDPVDLEPRPGDPLTGWPFGWHELARYYARAGPLCGLNGRGFDPLGEEHDEHDPFRFEDSPLLPGIYRPGLRDALIAGNVATIDRARNIRFCTDATVLRLRPEGLRIGSVAVASRGGGGWSVRSRRFVLACGAVENARILLVSDEAGGGIGNESGWVGRCFMEHPRDRSLSFRPVSPAFFRSAGFYDLHPGPEGAPRIGRIGLQAAAVRSDDLPNASGTLFPRYRRGAEATRRAWGPLAGIPGFRRLLPPGGHGWSRHPLAPALYDRVSVLLNVEQRPHPDNRIVIGTRRDGLGIPVPELHWRWRAEDQARLERLRRTVAAALEDAGAGPVTIDHSAPIDPNAHHHAGTTRMHDDPGLGVVDATGRVHTVDNLFVTGASVFPTAGYANPVLTIVALAVRLADHLAGIAASHPGKPHRVT